MQFETDNFYVTAFIRGKLKPLAYVNGSYTYPSLQRGEEMGLQKQEMEGDVRVAMDKII